MNSEYQALVKNCAAQGVALAQNMAADGLIEPLYLYYRQSEPAKPGQLFLVRDSAQAQPDQKLATGEGLRGHVPYDGYFQWVYDRAKNCPILPI